MLNDDKLLKNTIKNSALNIFVIGTLYAIGSYYINYKPKEQIAAIYEQKFQKNIKWKTKEDVFGNIKEKKRINISANDEKKL